MFRKVITHPNKILRAPNSIVENVDEVKDLIWREITKANDETSSLEVRKFRMIPKELDHEEGELTATQKVKRNVLLDQFNELIEEMYT